MKTRPNDPINSCEVSYTEAGLVGVQTGQTTGIDLGLTKREHFAALFVSGMLANPELHNHVNFDSDRTAGEAVVMADKLIQELNK